jgi:hypothetical protein
MIVSMTIELISKHIVLSAGNVLSYSNYPSRNNSEFKPKIPWTFHIVRFCIQILFIIPNFRNFFESLFLDYLEKYLIILENADPTTLTVEQAGEVYNNLTPYIGVYEHILNGIHSDRITLGISETGKKIQEIYLKIAEEIINYYETLDILSDEDMVASMKQFDEDMKENRIEKFVEWQPKSIKI